MYHSNRSFVQYAAHSQSRHTTRIEHAREVACFCRGQRLLDVSTPSRRLGHTLRKTPLSLVRVTEAAADHVYFKSHCLSCVFRALNNLAFHLRPVNIVIDRLIDFTAQNHIVASNQVESVFDLRARLRVIRGSDDPFNCVQQDKIRQLIRRQECP